MNLIAELRRRLEEITLEQRSIHETAGSGDLTPAQQNRWNTLETEAVELRESIQVHQDREDRSRRIEEHRSRYGLDIGIINTDPADRHELSRMGNEQVRDNALRLLERDRRLAPHQLDRVDTLVRSQTDNVDGALIARLISLTETPEYRSGFQQVMSTATPVLTSAEASVLRSVQDIHRAMSSGTDNAGGYGVPTLLDPTIVLTAQQSANPFLDIARVETITSDKWTGVSSDGVSWSWDAESTEVSDDSPTLAQPSIDVHTARGFVPFSIQVGMDYPRFAEEISRLLTEGYDELTAEAFATGSGTGRPKGIFTALDANTNVEVVVTTDGAYGAADLSKVWIALPDRAKPNATWLMSEDVKERTRLFGTDEHASRTVTLEGAEFRIRERPVRASGFAPAFTGSTGAANILVVGDFRKYLIVQRIGMQLELVPHLFGTTNNRPTGERGYFAWARVGADVVDAKAFRLLQNQ